METGLAFPAINTFLKERILEYLLVAQPDAGVNNKILEERKNFQMQYGERHLVKAKPHIAIAGFKATEAMEETIIRWIERICLKQPVFDVSLNNFGGIPPRQLYLRVQNPMPFQNLAHELKVLQTYVRSNACPSPRLVKTPMLSIGDISEEMYQKVLMDYAQKSFHETFAVEQILLMRRSNEYDTYKTVNVFKLQPLKEQLFN